MALETKKVDLTKDVFVAIGTNVTSLSAVSPSGTPFFVHVVATGGSVPANDTQDVIPIDVNQSKQFSYLGGAADIYALTKYDSVDLRIVRE